MSCCGAADVDELDVESLVEEAAQAGGVLGEHRAVHLAVGVDDPRCPAEARTGRRPGR